MTDPETPAAVHLRAPVSARTEVGAALERLTALGCPTEVRPLFDPEGDEEQRTRALELLAGVEASWRAQIRQSGADHLRRLDEAAAQRGVVRVATAGPQVLVRVDGYPIGAVFPDTRETVTLEHPDLAELREEVRRAAGPSRLFDPAAPVDKAATAAYSAALDALRDGVVALFRHGTAPRRRRHLPRSLAQATFPEAKATSRALADAAHLRGWEPLTLGELAMRWSSPGDPLQVRFDAERLAKWWDIPRDVTDLQALLRQLGFHAMVLFNVVVALVSSDNGVCDLTLDDLIERIGWVPHSRQERDEMRRQVWLWLNAFAATAVIGARRGKWRDPDTRKLRDMATSDPLLSLSVPEVDGVQLSLDPGNPPPVVTLYAAGILARFRGDRRVLSDYGDVLALGAIPNRKPSGAWAQGVGFALQQRWREMADWAADHPRRYRFTRRDLLDAYRPPPAYDEVLGGEHPQRARTYWAAAVRILRDERHLIGLYAEPAEPLPRYDWADAWLAEQLTIEPRGALVVEAAQIAWGGRQRRRAGAAPRAPRRPKPRP